MLAVAAWEYPTAVAAVLVAVGVIGKAAHWLYNWAQRIDGSLTYIQSEMSFNGGATMRDAVKRIETRLDRIEGNQADVASELQVFRQRSSDAVDAVRGDVAMLLEHDAERDTAGRRYGPNETKQEDPS